MPRQLTGAVPSILPPATIGIIGGGQLGRMMALSARQMGYRIAVLEPGKGSPLGQLADKEIDAAYDDDAALRQLLTSSEVTTYEFENVSARAIAELATVGNLPQGDQPIYLTQHRLREKDAINGAGFPTAPYADASTAELLTEAISQIGLPSILKTHTGGYDGKGQLVLRSESDIPAAYELVANAPAVLEGFVPFDLEISVIAHRSISGEVQVFGPFENVHRNSILHRSSFPAALPEAVAIAARELGTSLMQRLGFVGTLAIELFVVGTELIVNELAPRPHNSGHLTIDGFNVSQFEQHIRAITGLPLVTPHPIAPSIMINILGQHLEYALTQWQLPEFAWGKLHLYGKAEPKRDRKVGHITFVHPDPVVLRQTVEAFLTDFPT